MNKKEIIVYSCNLPQHIIWPCVYGVLSLYTTRIVRIIYALYKRLFLEWSFWNEQLLFVMVNCLSAQNFKKFVELVIDGRDMCCDRDTRLICICNLKRRFRHEKALRVCHIPSTLFLDKIVTPSTCTRYGSFSDELSKLVGTTSWMKGFWWGWKHKTCHLQTVCQIS